MEEQSLRTKLRHLSYEKKNIVNSIMYKPDESEEDSDDEMKESEQEWSNGLMDYEEILVTKFSHGFNWLVKD